MSGKPTMCPSDPPAAADLGLGEPTRESDSWPLHAKETGRVDVQTLAMDVTDEDLRNHTLECLKWTGSRENLKITWPSLVSCQIPYAKFSPADINKMLEMDKIRPFGRNRAISAGVTGFTVVEEAKKRRRPIFVPNVNEVIDKTKLPPVKYPARLFRRCQLAGKRYFAQFDFKAWYDQFEMTGAEDCYVLRTKEEISWKGATHQLFYLTKMPMGSTFSAHVAQTVTWAILEPILKTEVFVATMIDNVAFASDNEQDFIRAVQTFVERCDRFGAVLNDRESIPRLPEEIIAWGTASREPYTFLGEEYVNGAVRNTERNVKKLKGAFDRLKRSTENPIIKVTRRQVAAIIGLINWMTSTVQIPLYKHFEMTRIFRKLERGNGSWDHEVTITGKMLNTIGAIAGLLIENEAKIPRHIEGPPLTDADYEVVIHVDASASGYGAYITCGGSIHMVRGGWKDALKHSAWAEPCAATRILGWVMREWFPQRKPRVAVVTDHIAMAKGQRRPLSGNAGFSTAFFLNEFFKTLYEYCTDPEVFYVEGHRNVADAPSRASKIGDTLVHTVENHISLPPLESMFHPHSEIRERVWWNV